MFVAIGGNVKERPSFFVMCSVVQEYSETINFDTVTWNIIPSYCTLAQSLQNKQMYRM